MEEKLDIISKKLSILIALMAKCLPEPLDTKEGVRLLDSYDLSNNEVASILGMKPNAVSMARARMKGQKNGKAEK